MFFLSLVGISVIPIESSVQTKEIEKSPIDATKTGTTVSMRARLWKGTFGVLLFKRGSSFGAAWCRNYFVACMCKTVQPAIVRGFLS